MNRTDTYEENLRTVETATNAAIAARTVARAYNDYGAMIRGNSFSTVGDYARDELVNYTIKQAKRWTDHAARSDAVAERARRETTS